MGEEAMIDQPVKKTYMKYVSLGVLSMVGTSLFILADTFFIANGVGADGIAALNIVLPMINIFNGIGWMLGVGGATLFAIAKGRGDVEEGQADFSLTVIFSFIVALLFAAVGFLFSDPILSFLGAEGPIHDMAKGYYLITIGFSPVFIMNFVVITFLRNDNSPNIAMAGLLVGGLVNIILDYIFIFPLQLGMEGAALATVASPGISLLFSLFHLRKENRTLEFKKFTFSFNKMKRLLSIGFPSFLNEFSSALVMFLFNITILQLVGNIGVSAYAIIANMNIVVIAIFTGVGQGYQPVVSLFYGARRKKEGKKLLTYALTTYLVLGIFFFLVGLLFSDQIVSLFNGENNEQLAALASPGIKMYFSSFLFTGLNFAAIYFMSAVEKARPALIISFLRGVILIVPVLLIMAGLFSLNGVWLTMTVVEVLTLVVSMVILRFYNRKYL